MAKHGKITFPITLNPGSLLFLMSMTMLSLFDEQLKCIWYVKMAALEDVEVQRRGFVNVMYNLDIDKYEAFYVDVLRRIKRIINDSLPYRNVSHHYCLNDPKFVPALSLLQLVAGKENRVRFRTHFGKLPSLNYSYSTLLSNMR